MQAEKILRAAIYIAKLRDSGERAHVYRIRLGKKIADIVDSFVAEEVQRATSVAKSDPAAMSWAEVASALEISKSAAYNRYGNKTR
jgi:hypothetical protein